MFDIQKCQNSEFAEIFSYSFNTEEKNFLRNIFVFSNITQEPLVDDDQQKDFVKINQVILSIYYDLLNRDKIFFSQTFNMSQIFFKEERPSNSNTLLSLFISFFISTRDFFDFNFEVYDHITLDDIFKGPFLESINKLGINIPIDYLCSLNWKLNNATCIDFKNKLINYKKESDFKVLSRSELIILENLYKIAIQTHLYNIYRGKNNNFSLNNIINFKILFEASKSKLTKYCKRLFGDFDEENFEIFEKEIQLVLDTTECDNIIFFYFYDFYEMILDFNGIYNESELLLKIKTKYEKILENILELIKNLDEKLIIDKKLSINIMFYLNQEIFDNKSFEIDTVNLKNEIEKFSFENSINPELRFKIDLKISSSLNVNIPEKKNSTFLPVFSFLQYQDDNNKFDKLDFIQRQSFLKNWTIEYHHEIKQNIIVNEETRQKRNNLISVEKVQKEKDFQKNQRADFKVIELEKKILDMDAKLKNLIESLEQYKNDPNSEKKVF